MGDPETRDKNMQIASLDIGSLLVGDHPRLIDEWQEVPRFWDAIRFRVDHAEGFGHYILTGSAVPPDVSEITHSGTGRIVRLKMRPMSLWESCESSGVVALSKLLEGESVGVVACEDRKLSDIAYLVCRGGWPRAVEQNGDMALDRAEENEKARIQDGADGHRKLCLHARGRSDRLPHLGSSPLNLFISHALKGKIT